VTRSRSLAPAPDIPYRLRLPSDTAQRRRVLAGLVVLLLVARVARADAPDRSLEDDADLEASAAGFPDPIEPLNRLTFRLNLHVDRWVIDPITRAYRFVVPSPARRSIRRAFANLNSPSIFANDALQLRPVDAGVTAARFAINTTVGVVGLFDVADRMGLEGHHADFGQTLALAGVPSGPYLMLPVIGPTTARDGVGALVDFLFEPTTYILTPGAQLVFVSIRGTGSGLSTWETQSDALHALQASSIDFYAALRNAYWQNRVAEIERPPQRFALARR
jgi:phospholipid-binding lipoprotein MlaA